MIRRSVSAESAAGGLPTARALVTFGSASSLPDSSTLG
jgi:hypothetical protein